MGGDRKEEEMKTKTIEKVIFLKKRPVYTTVELDTYVHTNKAIDEQGVEEIRKLFEEYILNNPPKRNEYYWGKYYSCLSKVKNGMVDLMVKKLLDIYNNYSFEETILRKL